MTSPARVTRRSAHGHGTPLYLATPHPPIDLPAADTGLRLVGMVPAPIGCAGSKTPWRRCRVLVTTPWVIILQGTAAPGEVSRQLGWYNRSKASAQGGREQPGARTSS
jgi:hypothetical protein